MTIEEAIDQLEAAVSELAALDAEEAKATRQAVREAEKEAKKQVREEFKGKREAAREKKKLAEREIRDAKARIQRALGSRNSSADRAPAGFRAEQFEEYVKKNPGKRISEIAEAIGIYASSANPIAKKLVSEGRIIKSEEKTYTAP